MAARLDAVLLDSGQLLNLFKRLYNHRAFECVSLDFLRQQWERNSSGWEKSQFSAYDSFQTVQALLQ